MIAVASVIGTVLVAVEPIATAIIGLPTVAAYADPPVAPSTITLASDKTEFALGQSATLTATSDVDVAPTASVIRIIDQTTGATLASCSTGVTCTATTTFTSGAAHNYVATVNALTSNVVTVSRMAWTVSLASSATSFVTGATVTLTATANQNVGSTGGIYRIYIFDRTTNTLIKSCTTGTSCVHTSTPPFQSGPAHLYTALVAKNGTSAFATAIDTQATSNDVALERAAWSTTLTTNKSSFATGETVTLTSTANQSPSYTGGFFKHYIIDKSTGSILASCTTTACTWSSSTLNFSGAHDYVSVIAKTGASNYGSMQEIQTESNVVTVSRLAWTLILTASATEFAAGGNVSITATTNQNVNSSGFRIYIFDLTTGAYRTNCYVGSTCSTTVSFDTGGPHTFIAVLAPLGSYSTFSQVTTTQAVSNQVTISRKPWTISLSVDNQLFATQSAATIKATLNQGLTGGGYEVYIFDITSGARVAVCYTGGANCSGASSFNTGGSHYYVAVVGHHPSRSPASVMDVLDIQAISNTVVAGRKLWSTTLDGADSYVSTYELTPHANQAVGGAYWMYIADVTSGSTQWTSNSLYSYLSLGHNTCGIFMSFIASSSDTSYPYTDVQSYSAPIVVCKNGSPGHPGETAGGGNDAEKDAQPDHGDPVNGYNGEFYVPATDIGIAGVGPAFTVSRTYSSTSAGVDGPFGYGWSPNFASRIVTLVPGDSVNPLPKQLQVVQENGAATVFIRGENNTYLANTRVMAELRFDVSTQSWVFTRNSTEVMKFSLNGALLSIGSMQGVTILIGYDSSGQVSGMSSSGGRSMSFVWSGSHITQIADSAGRTVSYSYDTAGNLTSATGIDARITSYGYDPSHYMTSLTTPGGRTTTNVYDSSNRVVTQTDPLGLVTTFSYGATTTITAPDGSKTVDTYAFGQLISQTEAATTSIAATTTYVYDTAGNVTSMTDPLGRVTTLTYDVDGNLLSKVDALGRITQWTYDSERHMTSMKDALNRVTTMSYDSVGNLILITFPSGKQTQWTYNADGTPATATSAGGHVTYFQYDAAGRTTSVSDPDGYTTSIAYNSAGIVTSQTAPGGAVTTITPDAVGRSLAVLDPNGNQTTYSYNTAGDLTQVIDALGHTASSTYDAAGQVLTSTNTAGKVTTYAYTPAGHIASVSDPNGHTTSTAYDALGRPISTTDPLLRTTTYTYDLASQLLSITRPSGAQSSVVYDAAGQLSSATNALGQTSVFAYNAVGQQVSTTDPLGRITTTAYDLDGLVDIITLPDASTRQYDYSVDGQPIAFTNGDGAITTYSYSDSGLLLGKIEPGGLTSTYAYDFAGRPSVVTEPDSSTATYAYDLAGQLLSVDYSASSGVEATYTYDAMGSPLTMADATGTSSFAYDVVGRLVSETNGAGSTTGYGYDDAGQLTTIEYPGSRTVVYGHDAAGQMTSMTDWSTNTTGFTYTLDGQLATQVTPDGVSQANAYDVAGQLTSIAHTSGISSLANFNYAYDAAGQLTGSSSTLDGATIASDYGYDPISQLESVTTTPAGGAASAVQLDATPAGLLTATINGAVLTYNTAQQVTASTPLLIVPTTFGYDARGARVSETSGTDVKSFAYTSSGALASVTTPSTAVSYTSDARNLRQSRTEGGVTRQFTWSSLSGLPLLLDDGQHSYLYGPSMTPLAQVNDATDEVEYLHSDLLGTPRLVTDHTGAVVGTSTFDAFGALGSHSGVQSTFGFTGNLFDEATGLLYLRARDYDSATGQFLTVDPLVDQTRQPYAYVGNNPITRTDPSGLAAADINAFLLGVLDGLTGGISSAILEQTVPGYDAFIKEHNTAFTAGSVIAQVAVAVVVIVGTAGAGALIIAARYAVTSGVRTGIKAAVNSARQLAASAARTFRNGVDDAAGAAGRRTTNQTSDAMSCSVNSFTAGTPVLMADGSQKPIEDVEVGDEVLATDPQTGESGAREVDELIRHGGDHTMVDITLDDGTVIEATDEHPFWSASRGQFVFAIDLEVGELVLGADGDLLAVTETVVHSEDLLAYNLAIEGIHTYYAGETPVLVHNTCPNTWANPATLDRHFADHGADFNASSADEYADMASQFFVRSGQQKLPTKIDAEGTIRIYDPATNTFGSFAANGGTKTFFKPTSVNYWAKQPGVLQ